MIATLGFVIYTILYFIFIYSSVHVSGRINIWYRNEPGSGEYKREIRVSIPSVSDIKQCGDNLDYQYKVEKYVNYVVRPAQDYFTLRNKLEKQLKYDQHVIEIMFLAFGSLGWNFGFMRFILPNSSRILVGVFSAIAAIVLPIVLYFISCNKIGIKEFRYTKDELKELFLPSEFNLPENVDFNNYVIAMHYEYLKDIEDDARKVYVSKKRCQILSYILILVCMPLGWVLFI